MESSNRFGNEKITRPNRSTSAVVGFFGTINNFILLAAGLQLRKEAELIIWHQFSGSLARSHWRDMDVILLEKTVQMDADISAAQIELDAMGMKIENKRGAPRANPFLLVIVTLERRQRLIIR
jgi:hypothetical protein